jgi:hypothetical protein
MAECFELTADNSIIGHLLEVLTGQDVSASGGCDKDLSKAQQPCPWL